MKEPKLMTLEEAIEKYSNASGHTIPFCKNIIKGLEALGLIKFKEEKKKLDNMYLEVYDVTTDTLHKGIIHINDLIKHFENEGYTVTKNG